MRRRLALLLPAIACSAAAWTNAQCELQKVVPAGEALKSVRTLDGDDAVVLQDDRFALFHRTPLGWVLAQELSPPGATPYPNDAVLDGDRLVVSFYQTETATSQIFVYERPGAGQPFVPTGQITPSLLPNSSQVLLALEGDLLVVGYPEVLLFSIGVGDAFVFEHVAGSWNETMHVQGTWSGVEFGGTGMGSAVAVDGGRAFILEHGYSGAPFQGIHVYSKSGAGTWAEDQQLWVASGSGLIVQGDRLLVLTHSTKTMQVFEPVAGVWTETASFPVLSDGPADLQGSTLVLGDIASDLGGAGADGGAVHLYDASAGWSFVTSLLPSDPKSGAKFGSSVRLDGDALLVGAFQDGDAGAGKGAFYAWSLAGQGCATLTADVYGVWYATGGTQTLRVAPGPAFAGLFYVVAGSLSGFWPGTPFAGWTIPLNADLYLDYTLFHGGSPPLVAPFGFLDAQGEATVQVVLPPDANLEGLTAHHAFGVVDAGLNLVHVSNAAPLVVH